MIQSMTAFARCQESGEWGTLVWEIRSVNHRYLEMSTRLVEGFRELEAPLREKARRYLDRGKVECSLRYVPGSALQQEVTVNTALVRAIMQAGEEVARLTCKHTDLKTMDLLRWPGVLDVAPGDLTDVHQRALALFDKALEELSVARSQEGAALQDIIEQRLTMMQEHTNVARAAYPKALQIWKDRLQTRLDDIQATLDPDRIAQEMVIYAQKNDVDEELDRLETHIAAVRTSLKQGGAVGRRLDFLMQELNREANTLGSKSIDTAITAAAVELKVLIEQMREQIQNIE